MNSSFRAQRFDAASFFFTGLTGAATFLILAILALILANVLVQGLPYVSWTFLSSPPGRDTLDLKTTGVLPMILGTASKVILMTIFVLPVGVITAVYLTEYAKSTSLLTRFVRGAVNNLAGVPSIVFGLFGLGFFVYFLGQNMDALLNPDSAKPVWGKPSLTWAALTLAVMTLPVVIVATEEALRAIPQGLREGSLALGATKLQTIIKVVVPQALPGILTGGILAVSLAAGEVAPIIMTGAAYSATTSGNLTEKFMDLGFHVFILSTQSENVDRARPALYATVIVLLALTLALNIVAMIVRARMRKAMRLLH